MEYVFSYLFPKKRKQCDEHREEEEKKLVENEVSHATTAKRVRSEDVTTAEQEPQGYRFTLKPLDNDDFAVGQGLISQAEDGKKTFRIEALAFASTMDSFQTIRYEYSLS